MKIGYARYYSKKKNSAKLTTVLLEAGAERIFLETTKMSEKPVNLRPEYQRVLKQLKRGDTLIIESLVSVSRNYGTLVLFLQELVLREVVVDVLDLASVGSLEVLEVLKWVEENEQSFAPKVTGFKVKKETTEEKQSYHFLSRESEGRQMYWEIIQGLLMNKSLRRISSDLNVPRGTVYRIKKQFEKVKQTGIIISLFVATIASLKIAENYTSNLWLQLMICVVMTVLIGIFSYKDSNQ